MSDNPSIDPGTTPSISVEGDDIGGGVIRQAVVVAWGAKDASVRASAAAPLPVVQTGTPALPTGAALDSSLASILAKQPALGTAGTPSANVISVQGVASGTVLPVSGTVGVSGNVATTAAASSQADGHSATIGALADASSANTLVGLLKAIKAAITGTIAVSGTFWQATQPVSGTVTTTPPANASTNLAQVAGATIAQGHGTAATAVRVELPTDGTGVVGLAAGSAVIGQTTPFAAGTTTLTQVAGSASTGTLIAANANRKGAVIVNDSTAVLYVAFAATATSAAYTYKLLAGATLELPVAGSVIYTGLISGIWASATGNAVVTDMS